MNSGGNGRDWVQKPLRGRKQRGRLPLDQPGDQIGEEDANDADGEDDVLARRRLLQEKSSFG